MATTAVVNALYLGNRNGTQRCVGGPEQPQWKEAASQTYKPGYPVYLVSGKVTVAVTHATNALGAGAMIGWARKKATGTTDTKAPLRLLQAGDIIAANYYENGVAAATVITNLGVLVQLKHITAGKLICDLYSDGSSTAVDAAKLHGRVIGFYADDALGDTGGKLIIEIHDQPALRS